MSSHLVIAVDAMSGDRGAAPLVAGAALALSETPGVQAILVGQPALLAPLLQAVAPAIRARLHIEAAEQVVAMDESPRAAVRHKKRSSMRVAIDLVRAGRAQACVSAGNTGALLAISHFVLRNIEGVERAAIMSTLPSLDGHTHMLDLGANATVTAQQLCQFAAMGHIVARDVHRVALPRVGLLNIGEEDIKGHDIVQQAHRLIAASGLNYVGFVEGDDIFAGAVDVVVTDGFTGNVALKTAEGLARLVHGRLRAEFRRGFAPRLAALAGKGAFARVAASLDPGRYNGACMVGLKEVVVKSHGRADAPAFARAVQFAADAVQRQLPAHIAAAFASGGA